MTMNRNLRLRLSTRNFQLRVGSGSTFARSGFDAPRSVADAHLRDQREQGGNIRVAVGAQTP